MNSLNDNITLLSDNDNGVKDTSQKGNNNGDSRLTPKRPHRKTVPLLGEGDFAMEKTKHKDGPPSNDPVLNKVNATRNPILTTTSPSVDEDMDVTEIGETERPIAVEPRKRRVSDVIDSLGEGNSAPNSPRNRTFSDAQKSPTRTIMETLPDFLTKAPVKTPVRDTVDAMPMGSTPDEMSIDDPSRPDVVAMMPTERHDLEYNMNHPRRGKAYIFNHEEFDIAGYSPRLGTDVDAKNLEATFVQLGFQVSVFHNLEHAEIKTYITQLRDDDHSDADCVMVAVLSHGMKGGFVLARDVPYPIDSLWHAFKADLCPTLAGKPKIFLVQACRGTEVDPGVHMMRSGQRTQTDSASADYKLPSFADFLVAFSTMDGHYAWRNPEFGTWFVQCICAELRESAADVDLLKLMTRASRRVAVDHESFNDLQPWQHAMKQVPSVTTMLIRDVYFRPKPAMPADN